MNAQSLRIITAAVAAILTAAILSPSALAQDQIEVEWSRLAQMLEGRVVSTVLADGTVLKGRVLDVSESELRFQVKKTSKPYLYPRGESAVPKGQVKVFSYTYRTGSRGRKIGAAIGAAAGAVPTMLVASTTRGEGGSLGDVNETVGGVLAGFVGAGLGVGYGVGYVADTKTMTVVVAKDEAGAKTADSEGPSRYARASKQQQNR